MVLRRFVDIEQGLNAMAREPRPQLRPPEELGDTYVDVWRKPDAKVREDAKALWARLKALPPDIDPEARADELCVVAYVGDQLAAVSTAELARLDFLRQRFAFWRVLVAPEFRRNALSREIQGRSRQALEAWSVDHPEENVLGMATIVQNERVLALPRRAIWRSSGLALVGYTDKNEQIRVAWFDHALV